MSTDDSKKIQELIEEGFKGVQLRLDAFEEVHTIMEKQQDLKIYELEKEHIEQKKKLNLLEKAVSGWIFIQKNPIVTFLLAGIFITFIIWLDLPSLDKDKILEFIIKHV